MAQAETDPDRLMEILTAMSRIGGEAFLPVFRANLDHRDPIVAGLCMEMAGRLGDEASIPALQAQVTANEAEDRYETCEVTTWKAIDALADIGGDQALEFLASKIHHANPTARRLVHEALVRAGSEAVPHVAPLLRSGDPDEAILAANVLGFIGGRKGADALIAALDDGELTGTNQRFAAFEAMGRIPTMKSLVCLLDALGQEQDDSVLLAVMVGLEAQANPGVAEKAASVLRQGADEEQRDRVLRALTAAQAVNLFRLLATDAAVAQAVVDRVRQSKDPGAAASFRSVLQGMEGQLADALAAQLDQEEKPAPGRRLLAVDDSGAMRNFYSSAAAELGFKVTCAENGQEALEALQQGPAYDLMVVDMNMPVMDGIEFTTKARAMPEYGDTPIVMATTESGKSQSQLAKNAGVSSFLKKPFTFEVLQNKIAKVMNE
jgi:CheY-like chemotaxis protein